LKTGKLDANGRCDDTTRPIAPEVTQISYSGKTMPPFDFVVCPENNA